MHTTAHLLIVIHFTSSPLSTSLCLSVWILLLRGGGGGDKNPAEGGSGGDKNHSGEEYSQSCTMRMSREVSSGQVLCTNSNLYPLPFCYLSVWILLRGKMCLNLNQ